MRTLHFLFAVAALSLPATAWAQAKPADGAAGSEKTKGGAAAAVTTKDFVATSDPNSPIEKPNETYYFVGARFREVWIPQFMMGLFADGGTTVGVPAGGAEFTIRKNGFEYVLSLMYASYGMDWTLFKGKGEPDTAYELVKSQLGIMYLMSDFLWSTELNNQFAVNYGAGLGLGFVLGDLSRVQAKPGDGPGSVGGYVPCNYKGDGPYCGDPNDHFGDYKEPSWANGGSKPIVFPWLALQTGFRYKPHRHFMARFDLGWDLLNGPFLGIAGNYGL